MLALSGDGGTLYVGGSFTSVGGQTRNDIAALSTANGTALLFFDPNANGPVYALALSSDGATVYAGGNFATIGGQATAAVAALSTADGTALSFFNPNANGIVYALALAGDGATLYVGGVFTSIGGQTRNDIAALSTADGTAITAFNPDANAGVNALALSGRWRHPICGRRLRHDRQHTSQPHRRAFNC